MVSVEVSSLKSLTRLEFSNVEYCLFEADMGDILNICFADSSVLEVVFSNGTLRLDISREELSRKLEDCLNDSYGVASDTSKR